MGTRTYSRRAADGTRKLTALGRARAGQVGQTPISPKAQARASNVNQQAQSVEKSATRQLGEAAKVIGKITKRTIGDGREYTVYDSRSINPRRAPDFAQTPATEISVPDGYTLLTVSTGRLGDSAQKAYSDLYESATSFLSAAQADAFMRQDNAGVDAASRAFLLVTQALRAIQDDGKRAFIGTRFTANPSDSPTPQIGRPATAQGVKGGAVFSPIASLTDSVVAAITDPAIKVAGSAISSKFKARFAKQLKRLQSIEQQSTDMSVRTAISSMRGKGGDLSGSRAIDVFPVTTAQNYAVFDDGSF